ncbi:phage tail protein [Croceicoccus sediminis]|uniref:phage tail protein n=1 Tax=Croceicoccus sediminis TaxID=2571150 RepID=UPI0011844762|nr:phage tail protein [Croceicoccus sediminis]
MATLVLTTVGTALGGPLGGALGTLAGRAIDGAVFGSPSHEGPRLKELSVTTSTYGSPISRHFGTVRAAGSIIWATDLVEHKDKSGGGKNKPKVTTYSYTMSFAVALASRPIKSVGRIWADGNLLRGSRGDLKVGGTLRIYYGSEDQAVDPLIASDVGTGAPAFRGISYIVFEDLELADFGNRIPALTFEVIAGESSPQIVTLLGHDRELQSVMQLEGVTGISHETGSDTSLLAMIDTGYPLAIDASRGSLSIFGADSVTPSDAIELPPAIADSRGEFGQATGSKRSRKAGSKQKAMCLRYYDKDRDFQPGLQRSRGVVGNGAIETVEFPAGLTADAAHRIAQEMAERALGGRERMAYRVAAIDPAIRPGAYVRPKDSNTVWQVAGWEWRSSGVELELRSVQQSAVDGISSAGDAGTDRKPRDLTNGPTLLEAFELPWDGTGSSNERRVYAALSSVHAGWTGAALHVDVGDGILLPVGSAQRGRAIMGSVQSPLPAAPAYLIDRSSRPLVQLADAQFALTPISVDEMAQGRNRARLGNEIIQFASAVPRGEGLWELATLLRGRGGTEHEIANHVDDEPFVLLDDDLTAIDADVAGSVTDFDVVALGHADPQPVRSPLASSGLSLRPLSPIRPILVTSGGSISITWTRRARGFWSWPDEVGIPLVESSERYEVRFIDAEGDALVWEVTVPGLDLDGPTSAALSGRPGPARFEIRQIGDHARSLPVQITF